MRSKAAVSEAGGVRRPLLSLEEVGSGLICSVETTNAHGCHLASVLLLNKSQRGVDQKFFKTKKERGGRTELSEETDPSI